MRLSAVISGFALAAHWLSPLPPAGWLTWCDRAKLGRSECFSIRGLQ